MNITEAYSGSFVVLLWTLLVIAWVLIPAGLAILVRHTVRIMLTLWRSEPSELLHGKGQRRRRSRTESDA